MPTTLTIRILGEPRAKQSSKIAVINGVVRSYQPKEVVQNEKNIRAQIISQLPKRFKPFDGMCFIKTLVFTFPYKKNIPKFMVDNMGIFQYKATKPDIHDNLKKSLFDAMNKVVFIDDSIVVAEENTMKVYGDTPDTVIIIEGYYAFELEEIRDKMKWLYMKNNRRQ